MTTRKRHSAKVKSAIIARQGGLCALSGLPLIPGQIDFDHERALALGGADTPENLRAVNRDPHKAKTKIDRAYITKADAQKRKTSRDAIRKPKRIWPKRELAGRGFADNLTRKFNGTVIPRAPRAAQ